MKRLIKRVFDLTLTIPAILVFSPVLLVLAILVRLKLGSPIFFRQERPGLNGEIFQMVKFRTMTDGRDADGNLLPDHERMTRFGSFLRKSSLDELPELWNVLLGQMSLVGPRPLLVKYLELYSPEQMRRHDVPPGVTGWSQVNGRNSISWEEKFALDVWYVENHSVWLDIKIIFKTVFEVLKRDGVSAEGHVTAPEFLGSPESSSRPVAVIGAGGHGKVVISTLRAAGKSILGVYDDSPESHGQTILGVPVLGTTAELLKFVGTPAIIAIGNNKVRQQLAAQLPCEWISVVHPHSSIDPTAEIGPGSIVMAGVVIQPLTKIGAHAILNTASTVDHDCQLGDFVHIAPGTNVAGTVSVGTGVFCGTGSRIIPEISIGEWSILGAGAVAVQNIPAHVTAVGVPAMVIKQHTPKLKAS